jgi:hypothetical protein
MPGGMPGLELAMKLSKRNPGIKVIIACGYSGDHLEQDLNSIAYI